MTSAIAFNKGYSFAFTPLVCAGLFGHIWKAAPTDLSKHKKLGAGVLGFAVLSNAYAAYASGQIFPME